MECVEYKVEDNIFFGMDCVVYCGVRCVVNLCDGMSDMVWLYIIFFDGDLTLNFIFHFSN